MCALNGKLYIVGGSDPYGQKGLKNCDVFDPVTKSWTSCAPLNIRELIFLCVLFFVLGGCCVFVFFLTSESTVYVVYDLKFWEIK